MAGIEDRLTTNGLRGFPAHASDMAARLGNGRRPANGANGAPGINGANHANSAGQGPLAADAQSEAPTRRRLAPQWLRRNRLWRTYLVGSLLLRTLYIINRERSRVVKARAKGDYEARPDIEALIRILREFRETAVALGGLLIKLGQFFGARADLLPPEALDELSALQDEVPAERFDDIKRVIERELHAPLGEVFAAIDPVPAGAASLGQVHQARLLDGRVVAIKVQRPGIDQIVRTDLGTLRFVLRIVRWLSPALSRIIDLQLLYREFSRTVYEELDYQREGHNAEQFGRIFADDALIDSPSVLWQYSTRRVLALEWVDGIKINDIAALDAAGVDRAEVATRLANAYFKQVFDIGFFHADPHPGNLFVQPQPSGPARIAFVDFGMMGTITPRLKGGLRDCFAGLVQQDAALVTTGLEALGFFGPTVDRNAIEQAVGVMLTQFSGLPINQVSRVDQREVMQDLSATLYDQPLRIPAQFAFFGRAMGILLGVVVTLSPNFNFLEVATPYAQQFIRESGVGGVLGLLGVSNLSELGQTALREGLSLARSLADLPRRLDRVLARAERGDLRVIIQTPDLDTRAQAKVGVRLTGAALNRPTPTWVTLAAVGAVGALSAVTTALLLRRRGAGANGAQGTGKAMRALATKALKVIAEDEPA